MPSWSRRVCDAARLGAGTQGRSRGSGTHLLRHRVAGGPRDQPCCGSCRTCSARRRARPPAQAASADWFNFVQHAGGLNKPALLVNPPAGGSAACTMSAAYVQELPQPRRTWKHSQYFFKQLLFLQLQPLLWRAPPTARLSACGRQAGGQPGSGRGKAREFQTIELQAGRPSCLCPPLAPASSSAAAQCGGR